MAQAPKLPRGVQRTTPIAIAFLAIVVVVILGREPTHEPAPTSHPQQNASLPAASNEAHVAPHKKPLPSPTFCGDKFACDGGECLDGRCNREQTASCEDDDDCPDGRCLFDGCEAGARECDSDAKCGWGLRCDRGWCLEGSRNCASDDDCDREERCAAGRCTQGFRACRDDEQCPMGERCELGGCVEGSANELATCHNDRPCNEGRCVNGACQPGLRECLDGRDCPPGFACREGLCRK